MRAKFCVSRDDDFEENAGGTRELFENVLLHNILQVAQGVGQLLHECPGVLDVSIVIGGVHHDTVVLDQQIVLVHETVEDRVGVDVGQITAAL